MFIPSWLLFIGLVFAIYWHEIKTTQAYKDSNPYDPDYEKNKNENN